MSPSEYALFYAQLLQNQERLSQPTRVGLNGTRSARPVGRPRVIFDRKELVKLRRQGLSWSQIASKLGVSIGTARRAYRELTAELSLESENRIPPQEIKKKKGRKF